MKRKFLAVSLVICICVSLLVCSCGMPSTSATQSIKLDPSKPILVDGGQITGKLSSDTTLAIYEGIPYAAAPVGDLRWKAPQAVTPWEGVKACTDFGNSAIQKPEAPVVKYTDEFLNANRNYSEDCLYLNVWTKAESATNKPVILFIHGGAFVSGGSSCPIYDGENIARGDAVFVNINYRLGIFGFMSSPELSAENNGLSGNYAVMDWVKALEWVKTNISKFGGDPNNVTIMGQSAGAIAISALTTCPQASGLFSKAFIMSSNAIGNSLKVTTLKDAEAAGTKLMSDNQYTLADLRALNADELRALSWPIRTVIDGSYIPDTVLNVYKAGKENKVPLFFSVVSGDASFFGVVVDTAFQNSMNADDYTQEINNTFGSLASDALVAYPAAGDASLTQATQINRDSAIAQMGMLAVAKAENSDLPTYLAYFSLPYAGDTNKGAFHSADIPYWLGGNFTSAFTFSETDKAVANQLSKYLINFAKTANPNGDELPAWEAFDGSLSYLNVGDDGKLSVMQVSESAQTLWSDFYGTKFDLPAFKFNSSIAVRQSEVPAA